MRIGLVDVDGKGSGFPNLALMKISAYHKAQGDEVEWANPMFGKEDWKQRLEDYFKIEL